MADLEMDGRRPSYRYGTPPRNPPPPYPPKPEGSASTYDELMGGTVKDWMDTANTYASWWWKASAALEVIAGDSKPWHTCDHAEYARAALDGIEGTVVLEHRASKKKTGAAPEPCSLCRGERITLDSEYIAGPCDHCLGTGEEPGWGEPHD